MITKIVSGGQTGADTGGLIAGQALGLRTGGWAPRGWVTDIGPEPRLADYGLKQTAVRGYALRTEWNVRDSDGTVWFGNTGSHGYRCTRRAAGSEGKPFYTIETRDAVPARYDPFLHWIAERDIHVLNVAGNRERLNPGIRDWVVAFLIVNLHPE